jgi:hypothetical protein
VSFENSGSESENASSLEVTLVDDVKAELSEIDSSDLSEHSARFEVLHGKLQEALSTIDGL